MSVFLILVLTIGGACLFVALMLLLASKLCRKHMVYEFKGHKIEVLTFRFRAEFWIDGKLIDKDLLSGLSYNFEFNI